MSKTTMRRLFFAPILGAMTVLVSCDVANAAASGSPTLNIVLDNDAGTNPTVLAAGAVPEDNGAFPPTGVNLGNSLGAGVDVQADWTQSLPSVGPNGGTQYTITVRSGSFPPNFRSGFYTQAIVNSGTTLPPTQDVINNATVSFGVGGGGISFDDGPQILIHSISSQIAYPAGFAAQQFNTPTTSAFVNPDGTLGFETIFDADTLSNAAVVTAFDGDLTSNGNFVGISGFPTTITVEVIPEPASVAMLSLGGLVALVAARRRRS